MTTDGQYFEYSLMLMHGMKSPVLVRVIALKRDGYDM